MLWLVYACGWLPALVCAGWLRPRAGPAAVLTGAGSTGVWASFALAASLTILGAAYLAALRRPPRQQVLLAACALSVGVALTVPLLFSADVYAYAYYGDLALHGRNPYLHDPAPSGDALAAAAVGAWNGHIPPRCVYGPLAVGIAAVADLAGAPWGVRGAILAARLAAASAYAVCVWYLLRLLPDPRARVAFALNPVVIWSVAEGHNDAAMLAFAFAGFAASRRRALFFALAALVKAPAVVLLPRRGWTAAAAAVLVAAGYLPLGLAVAAAPPARAAGDPAAWQSPLGLLAAQFGTLPAVFVVLVLLGLAALAGRRLAPPERTAALTLAAWFGLPNAYPWYALWIVPIAARTPTSVWSRALLVASLVAPARAVIDAVFPAPGSLQGAGAFHPVLIGLQYLPPVAYLGLAVLGGRRAFAAIVLLLLGFCRLPAAAQTSAPSPLPNAAPATPGMASPNPSPTGSAQVPQALPQSTPANLPAPAVTTTPAGSPSPSPPPLAPPLPPAGTLAPATPAPATLAPATPPPATIPPPAPSPTPNPFTYIITPMPVPATTPDGPHIIQVDLNDRRIHAGGPLIVRVFTSANVVGVEARALGRFIPIPQSSPGLFALAYTMPGGIPFWLLNKSYDIVIAAATADGRQTSVSFPMLLTR